MKHIKHINEFLFWGQDKIEASDDAKTIHKPITWMAHNDDVKELQQSLEDLGLKLPRFGVDSKFGPETLFGLESLIDIIKTNKDLNKLVDGNLEIQNKTVSPELQSIVSQLGDDDKAKEIIKKHFDDLYKNGDVKAVFPQIVQTVIDKFEGGYFHPNMLSDGRLKDDPIYHKGPGRQESSETMFGLDRKNGSYLYKNEAGRKFWKLIDDADAANKWAWNYRGGSLQPELKRLVSEIMYPVWEQWSRKYLKPLSKKIIESDKRLLVNFCYAIWNGEGFFRRFCRDFDKAVNNGVTDINELLKVAINSRTNSGNDLIVKSGNNMNDLFQSKNINVA